MSEITQTAPAVNRGNFRRALSGVSNGFWFGQVLFWRIFPITLLQFLIWNPWTPNWFSWTKHRVTSGSYWPEVFQSSQGVAFIWHLLVSVLLIGGFLYVFFSAINGYGRHWMKIGFSLVPFGLLGALEIASGGKADGPWFWTMVLVLFGLWEGIGFCWPLIHRKLQGVLTVTPDTHQTGHISDFASPGVLGHQPSHHN